MFIITQSTLLSNLTFSYDERIHNTSEELVEYGTFSAKHTLNLLYICKRWTLSQVRLNVHAPLNRYQKRDFLLFDTTPSVPRLMQGFVRIADRSSCHSLPLKVVVSCPFN